MQRLELDFQKKPATWPLSGIVLLVLGIALTTTVLKIYRVTGDDLEHADERVTHLKRDLERQRVFDTRSGKESTSGSGSTGIGRSRAQWEALFSGLESASDETVTLLSLDPTSSEISLRGEARDFAAMTDYSQRLSRLPVLSDVRLTDHEVARDNPRRPVRFSVKANWKEVRP